MRNYRVAAFPESAEFWSGEISRECGAISAPSFLHTRVHGAIWSKNRRIQRACWNHAAGIWCKGHDDNLTLDTADMPLRLRYSADPCPRAKWAATRYKPRARSQRVSLTGSRTTSRWPLMISPTRVANVCEVYWQWNNNTAPVYANLGAVYDHVSPLDSRFSYSFLSENQSYVATSCDFQYYISPARCHFSYQKVQY